MNFTTQLLSPAPSDPLLVVTSSTAEPWRFFSAKAWNLNHYADFEMPIDMLSESWPTVIALVALYLGMVFSMKPLKGHSKSNQWIPKLMDLATARHAWNSLLALYSVIGSLHLLSYWIHQVAQDGLYAALVGPDESFYQGPVGFWLLLFVLGKIVEFGDTLFLLMSGRRVMFLHWFHHATVFPCSWYALQYKIPMFRPCSTINYLVHAVMYSYFALNDTTLCKDNAAFKVQWAQRITTLQCTQFVLDLIVIGVGAYDRTLYGNPNIPYASVLLSSCIITSYLYLFLQFAEEKYAYKSQLKKAASNMLYRLHFSSNKEGTEEEQSTTQLPWNKANLNLDQRFHEATKMAAMLYGAATEQDLLDMYGCFKHVKEGPISDETVQNASDEKEQMKVKAWQAVKDLSKEEAQQKYITIMDTLSERNQVSIEETKQRHKAKQSTMPAVNTVHSAFQFPVRIAGHGRYLPQRIVNNQEIEEMGGFELSSQEKKRTGVMERRFVNVDGGENLIENGANVIRAACQKAGLQLEDLDLIVGGFGGHQFLPDDASLVQRQLGLGESGIRAFTVHATCLSFVVAMEVAASMMRDGKYRNVAVFASSISSVAVCKTDPHTAGLFGDGAAAVILQPSADLSTGIHGCHMETYGIGSDACQVRGGGTYRPPHNPKYDERMGYFSMNGQQTLALVSKYARGGLHNFIPGLEKSLNNLQLPGMDRTVDIDWVVPHQASAVALDSMAMFGWPEERILKTLHKYGNCVAASIPLTLCDSIDNGKIRRGDRVLLCGTSAGLSVGSLLFTY